MKKEIRDIELRIRVSKTELRNIQELAKSVEIPTATFSRNLLLSSLDDAMIYQKIGILKGAKKLIDFKEALKEFTELKFKKFKNI